MKQPEEEKYSTGSGNRERQELITKINTLFFSVSFLVFVQSFSCMNTGEALFSSFELIVYVLSKIKVR